MPLLQPWPDRLASRDHIGSAVVAALACLSLSGCSTPDLARLAQCEQSGAARFEAIPIASRGAHEQALRFSPSSPESCVVYVVRERDAWTAGRIRRTIVILALQDLPLPELPASPSNLPAVFGGSVLEIHDHIYAMWEVWPGAHRLQAFFVSDYGQVFLAQGGAQIGAPRVAGHELQCAAGEALFLAVGDEGFADRPVLKRLTPEVGKQSVRDGLRSAGIHDGTLPAFRDCKGNW
jgi:hypothetical protein